jgi:SSS family solute:Na+ symporter
LKPQADERHYVLVSRLATMLVMALALLGASVMTNVGDAWKYLFNLTAGVGLVMILRWYWWRVNAWSEIAALATSALVSNGIILLRIFPDADPDATAKTLLLTVPITTLVWIAVTFLTKPEPQATLLRFYERVRPSALGWGPIAMHARPAPGAEPLAVNALDWLAGCGLVYGSLFGIGKLVLDDLNQGFAYLAGAALCAGVIAFNLTRTRSAAALATRAAET